MLHFNPLSQDQILNIIRVLPLSYFIYPDNNEKQLNQLLLSFNADSQTINIPSTVQHIRHILSTTTLNKSKVKTALTELRALSREIYTPEESSNWWEFIINSYQHLVLELPGNIHYMKTVHELGYSERENRFRMSDYDRREQLAVTGIKANRMLNRLSEEPIESLDDLKNRAQLFEQITINLIKNKIDTENFPNSLNLVKLEIMQLPKAIFEIESLKEYWNNLKYLGLNCNLLYELPSLKKLKNLECFEAVQIKLNHLPSSIKYLIHLKKLDLRINSLTHLPNGITNLVNLTKLDLSNNKLIDIPEQIGNLNNLTNLNVSKNKFKNLPSSFSNLKKLEDVTCAYNELNFLPKLNDLTNLKRLDCSHNKLSTIPPVNQLVKLNKFDCSYNEITKLPTGIEKLKYLRFIDCENNLIDILPEFEPLALEYKRIVRCSNNLLTDLPQSLKAIYEQEEIEYILGHQKKVSVKNQSITPGFNLYANSSNDRKRMSSESTDTNENRKSPKHT